MKTVYVSPSFQYCDSTCEGHKASWVMENILIILSNFF